MHAESWRSSPTRSIVNGERLWRFGAFLLLMAGAFSWGVATIKWKLFPHDQLVYLESGFDALTKLDRTKWPHPMIELAPDAQRVDPVLLLGPEPAGDVILMTGGFQYRRDLCPEFGCLAWVMERDGKVLHRWQYDPSKLFDEEKLSGHDGERDVSNIYVQGADIDPDGNLIVTFQTRNMYPYQLAVARFDWIRIDDSHHWPTAGPDGRIYVPMARIERDRAYVAGTKEKLDCKFGAVFQEGVRILSPEGQVLREFWLDEAVRRSDMQGLAYSVRNDCDPYHVNGIALVNEAAAARLEDAREGDLLVSLRSSSALVLLDQDDGRIKHVLTGPMVAQHSPRFLPDGDVVVFDNLGGIDTKAGTRILKLDLVTGEPETLFPRHTDMAGYDLFSEAQGDVELSDDGRRALVAETLGGRVIEFDTISGKPIWSYRSISDVAPYYADEGDRREGPVLALMQTQGARYISRSMLRRLNGG
ncbi:hypothetical protein DEA8626_03209 [Defluviimonas aquaemixtae]|uniref:Arylsulfotransferase (ASST) n=1 Tax=Albidovulum aquaemixtae TaxID=1542388 RepID=A0A2R8BL48_9RHOB|nr:arylsulfotransferase family protein [Defluviimonas aquaemixtae]SPH24160.1 hypothetical protein DEA8626_03209 [Defluviimonas aquaemixtae]